MSHTVKLFERIVNHMLRTIVELGNTHFVSRGGRSTTGSTVDRLLLTTKLTPPNSAADKGHFLVVTPPHLRTSYNLFFLADGCIGN